MTQRISTDGRTVTFLEPSHKLPLVSIVIALRTGNAHDPPGKDGLSRLAVRMLRRGCEGLDARAIDAAIDRLGGEMSVDTSPSSVAIHVQVIGRNLDAFVDLLVRLLATPTFPEDELERLKRETVAEIDEAKDHDRTLAQQAFRRAIFGEHPYGRDGAGTVKSVRSITSADVRAFYKERVARGNVVLGFAGDLTEAKARAVAARLAGALHDGPAIADNVGAPTAPPGRRLVLVDKPERTQTQILLGTLGTWPHDPDHVAFGVANAVFGGTFTSRLMREVRSKRGWSYGASSRAAIDRQRHAFSMWTFPSATDVAACIALELELLEAFVRGGVTEEELAFIKGYLTRSYAFDIDTAPKRLHQTLDVELLGLPPDYYSGYVEHVKRVTLREANEAVARRIHLDDLAVVVVGTAEEILEPVMQAIPGLAAHEVVPFDAGSSSEELGRAAERR